MLMRENGPWTLPGLGCVRLAWWCRPGKKYLVKTRGGLCTTGNYDTAAFECDDMGTALGVFSNIQFLTIRE
jgi:hypothetical protein